MNQLSVDIERAVGNAPTIEMLASYPNNYAQFADRPDDWDIHLNETDVSLPNAVYVEAESGTFRELLRAVGQVAGISIDRQYIDDTVAHESEHWHAARTLKATSGRYGVMFNNVLQADSKTSVLRHRSFFIVRNLQTTKLGAALIDGHPLKPSLDDNLNVKKIGYPGGIEEIADKALALNAQRKDPFKDQYYPVPLSIIAARSKRRRFRFR